MQPSDSVSWKNLLRKCSWVEAGLGWEVWERLYIVKEDKENTKGRTSTPFDLYVFFYYTCVTI